MPSTDDRPPTTGTLAALQVAMHRIALILWPLLTLFAIGSTAGFMRAHRDAVGGSSNSNASFYVAVGLVFAGMVWLAWRSIRALRDHRRATVRKPRGQRQFRHYFLLVNLATLFSLIVAGLELFDPEVAFEGAARPIQLLFALATVAAVILMLIVVFGKSLRDEFAEECWRGAAMSTVKFLAAAPPVTIVIDAVIRVLAKDGVLAFGAGGIFPGDDAGEAVGTVWTVTLAVYFLAFQYHRWEASR